MKIQAVNFNQKKLNYKVNKNNFASNQSFTGTDTFVNQKIVDKAIKYIKNGNKKHYITSSYPKYDKATKLLSTNWNNIGKNGKDYYVIAQFNRAAKLINDDFYVRDNREALELYVNIFSDWISKNGELFSKKDNAIELLANVLALKKKGEKSNDLVFNDKCTAVFNDIIDYVSDNNLLKIESKNDLKNIENAIEAKANEIYYKRHY